VLDFRSYLATRASIFDTDRALLDLCLPEEDGLNDGSKDCGYGTWQPREHWPIQFFLR
jgi:hypothetical protein